MLSKVVLCQELSNSSKPDNWQSCCQSSNWAAFFAFPTSLQETWPGHISHTHLFQFYTGEILSTNLKKYFPKIWRNLARAHISYTSSSCCDPILAPPLPPPPSPIHTQRSQTNNLLCSRSDKETKARLAVFSRTGGYPHTHKIHPSRETSWSTALTQYSIHSAHYMN